MNYDRARRLANGDGPSRYIGQTPCKKCGGLERYMDGSCAPCRIKAASIRKRIHRERVKAGTWTPGAYIKLPTTPDAECETRIEAIYWFAAACRRIAHREHDADETDRFFDWYDQGGDWKAKAEEYLQAQVSRGLRRFIERERRVG